MQGEIKIFEKSFTRFLECRKAVNPLFYWGLRRFATSSPLRRPFCWDKKYVLALARDALREGDARERGDRERLAGTRDARPYRSLRAQTMTGTAAFQAAGRPQGFHFLVGGPRPPGPPGPPGKWQGGLRARPLTRAKPASLFLVRSAKQARSRWSQRFR